MAVETGVVITMLEDIDPDLEAIRQKKAKELLELLDGKTAAEQVIDRPVEANDRNLSDLISRHDLVVVDMWAPWCGPCKMIGPIIDRLAAKYKGKVLFAKVNVDQNPVISGQFGVQSIPTLLIFKSGSLIDRKVGALPQQALEALIDRLL